MAAEEESNALYKYLVDHMYDVEPERRRRSVWVMNDEWYEECTHIGEPSARVREMARRTGVGMSMRESRGWPGPGGTTMLGLPFVVREDGGVPHLEVFD